MIRPPETELLEFKNYTPSDYDNCLFLFDLNCPSFFAAEERADYISFLATNQELYLLGRLGHEIVSAFGIEMGENRICGIAWLMVHPEYHRKGYRSAMMAFVLKYARKHRIVKILLSTSQHSADFFEQFGAYETSRIENGWGVGMHRIDMEIDLPAS